MAGEHEDSHGGGVHDGNTERLMKYWAEGRGAIKIRWGEGGDFDRCRTHLGKFVGPEMVDGLCANLHHRAIGIWPATHAREIREAEGRTR